MSVTRSLSRHSGYALLAAVFLLWELLARLGWVDANYLPPVSEILMAMGELIASLEIVTHVLISLKRMALGFALGASIGYGLGFVCGYMPRVYHVIEFTVEFLRPMPSVALIPIGILFLGIGDGLNQAIIAYACSWPVFINTMDGVRSVDAGLINTARIYGLHRFRIITKVIVPASLPFVFTGLRVGLGIAVAVMVITEMVASGNGLGAFIFNTSISYRIPQMYAGIIVIGLFGYVLNAAFLCIEKALLHWDIGRRRSGYA